MLYIVNETTTEILFKIDAWDRDLEAKVYEFVASNNYTITKNTRNFNGDMILYVK